MSDSPRRGPRLLWTLLGALALVSVLPLVVSHSFLISINRDSLETLEKKYLTRAAVGIAGDVQNLVVSYQQQLLKIAGAVTLTSQLLPSGTDPFQHAQSGMNSYLGGDADVLALRILNRNGQGAEAKPPQGLEPDTVKELDFALSAALHGQPYAGKFLYVSNLNQPAVVIAVPVTDAAGQTSGVVEALVSLRRISERLGELGKGDVTAFLIDRDGRVLIHSSPAISVQRPDYSDLKIVKEFVTAPLRLTESYDDVENPGRMRVLGTVAPVGRPDWGVVVQKPEAVAFASVTKMERATIEWASGALLLALAVGVVFAAGISGPIRQLAQRTRDIAAGNYAQRAEVKARNEIGDLAENFNQMSTTIEGQIERLKKAANENHQLFINAVRMLAAAIDAKDPYTRGHSERVARYSIAIGKHLQMNEQDMRNLRISSLLHDVGKIGIDDRILRKPGALSEDEFEVMKTHPAKGAAIMSGVAQLIDIVPGMKYHHEKWAGGGYPDGLKEHEIPMQARIVAIADTFDAMTTNRPYQKAMELGYVLEKISSFAGSRFDPDVVAAFLRAVKSGDIQIDEQVRGAA